MRPLERSAEDRKDVRGRPLAPGSPDYPFKKPVVNFHTSHGPVHVKNKTIFVQIDGLSHAAFGMAWRMGMIPELLVRHFEKHRFKVKPFYCGQESATPASTAGFLYGTRKGFPSFRFLDRSTGRLVTAADRGVDPCLWLGEREPGLLDQGTVYTMFFEGDSREASFVKSQAAGLARNRVQKGRKPARLKWRRLWSMLRPDALSGTLLRAVRCGLSNLRWENAKKPSGVREVRGALSNVIRQTCLGVIARDLSCRGVKFDIARGVPVVWINFAGYDSQAHLSGPFSPQAFAALREIFKLACDIVQAVENQHEHDYHLYFLSDHGQVPSETFRRLYGETLRDYVKRSAGVERIVVAESGPHAHLYLRGPAPKMPEIGEKNRMARDLLRHPGIGMAAFRAGACTVITDGGKRLIVRNGKIVKGKAELLEAYGEPEIVAHHIYHEAGMPHSGDLILYGAYRPTPDGAGFAVDFEDHFWKGTHGGVGGHQGIPFVAFAEKDAINTGIIMGSWDLHYQFYEKLAGVPGNESCR